MNFSFLYMNFNKEKLWVLLEEKVFSIKLKSLGTLITSNFLM